MKKTLSSTIQRGGWLDFTEDVQEGPVVVTSYGRPKVIALSPELMERIIRAIMGDNMAELSPEDGRELDTVYVYLREN